MNCHVAVDLRILDREGMERTGVGRHALEVVRALRSARPGWRLTIHSNRDDLLRSGPRTVTRATRWPTASSIGRVTWLELGAAAAMRPRPDLWLGPTFFVPRAWRGPTVVAIHDLVFAAEPGLYRGRLNAAYAARATRVAAGRADLVLCATASLKGRIARDLAVREEKLRVVPWVGAGETLPRPPPRRRGYWLFVGRWEARKGLDVLGPALRRARERGAPARLVLAGGPGWRARDDVRALIEDPDVKVVLDPDDERLAELYAGALALVYPSRMEGFGMPVAEAMARGCPVIASDLPEVREWAGDVPAYVRPGDPERLADALVELAGDPQRRRAMGADGIEACRELRWENVGEAFAEAVEDVLRLYPPSASS